ncbi:GNAT family protein [Alisedimentitalea sp. MJ-SS2]|uniref:GNAT family N-acetyltransferase n=1 Tax=Aliisedimentitalea sp. MJ-SS2 TaxID=3049795 RepID=UPI00290D0EC8|nr:GNAT family protein [Alisedimentitalea sp. MJ-SS2]MDU8926990.1 GNAT family protein [Alisedimentitalea sp. MJ-SS2]
MMLEKVINQPVIETERFDLRPLRASDQGLIELYGGNARVAKNTTAIPHPMPPGASEDFIRRAQSEDRIEDVWAMDGSKSQGHEVMGIIGLKRIDLKQSEIGYWVAPAFWNAGLAQEAVAAMIEANPQGCDTIFASVFQDNPASARVLTNQGFQYLGDAETHSVARAANVPTWTYSLKC